MSSLLLPRRGFMFVLSSASGTGKTTLTRDLLQDKDLNLSLSISVTTRPRRSSEVDGIHYYFKTKQEFDRLRQQEELLEWAEVHGNFYGTPRYEVDMHLEKGQDVLFDIDYQGTQQIRQKAPEDVVSVFILPPSFKELRARLERRAEDSAEVIAKRLQNARHELTRWPDYDYVVMNEDMQLALGQVKAIVIAERLKRQRQRQALETFVSSLLESDPS